MNLEQVLAEALRREGVSESKIKTSIDQARLNFPGPSMKTELCFPEGKSVEAFIQAISIAFSEARENPQIIAEIGDFADRCIARDAIKN